MKKVAVVGLGYVGLPVACLCASKGYEVIGIDTDIEKISAINNGISPIKDDELIEDVAKKAFTASSDTSLVADADVIIVAVPTPVDENHMPNLTPLKQACQQITPFIKENAIVAVESTIHPGTTEEVILPILKENNKKFHLAHCPERIDPGNKKFTIKNIPRVVGGITQESAEKTAEFYRSILDASVITLSGVKEAEATKIMENTFRDINIAYINEMAMSFDKAGINILEVIRGAATKPFAFMPHYPGAGVGGHCIPVDPYYLIESAKQNGFTHSFLSLARKINEGMPEYTVSLLEENHGTIGVYGLAYKANIDDTRESPAQKIIEALASKNITPEVFDPLATKKNTVASLKELLEKTDTLIIATNHKEISELDPSQFKEANISAIIDGRNCLDKEKIKALNIAYKGIGQR